MSLRSLCVSVCVCLCLCFSLSVSLSDDNNGDGISSLVSRADSLLAQGAPEAALAAYKEVLAKDPDNTRGVLGVMKSKHLSKLLSTAIIAGEGHPVDWTPVRKAIQALKDGKIKLWNPSFKVSFPDYTVQPPTPRYEYASEVLWNFYQRTVHDERLPEAEPEAESLVRELLLLLLDQGLNMDRPFDNGRHPSASIIAGTPLGKAISDRRDLELVDALLASNVPVKATFAAKGFEDGEQAVLQFADRNGVPTPDEKTGCTYMHLLANGALQVSLVRELYQVYTAGVAGRDREVVIKKNKLDKLEHYSPTLNRVLTSLRNGEPMRDVDMMRTLVWTIDQEVEGHIARGLYARRDFNFEDLSLDVLTHLAADGTPDVSGLYARNPVMVAVFMGRVAMLRALNDEIEKRSETPREEGNVAVARVHYAKALADPTAHHARTALHIAAMRYGQDSAMFHEVVRGERLASGNDARMSTLLDAEGRCPLDYDGKASAVASGMEALAERFARDSNRKPAPTDLDYSESDTGGWGLGPAAHPSELDLDDGSAHCDVREVHGLPTREEFELIIDQNQPVLFRGAANDWRIRELWQKRSFLRKYGDRTATTALIPYGQLFDVTDPNVTVQMTIDDYVAAWGQPEEQRETLGAPRYFFSTEFAETNPDLLEDLSDLTQLLEGYEFLGKQFYLGPAHTGAPLHWHNTALNVLAYGRKRWFLVDPNHTFYSVKPAKLLWKEDSINLAKNMSMKQCVQNAGDVIFVGDSWGHATVNEEPSIGFAMEFVDSRISINLGAPRIISDWFDDIERHNPHFDPRNVPRRIQTRAAEGLTYHGLNSDL